MRAVEPRGWCPTALRPMATGDGLLVRVHPPGTALTAAQTRALARAADAHGNGLLDLSSRGNLQIRGVLADSHGPLVEELAKSSLIDEVDASGRPHVAIVSPLSGLDPSEILDLRPVAQQVDRAVAFDPDLTDLPAKFCVALDGGGLSLDQRDADLRLRAVAPDRSGPGLAVALAESNGLSWIGVCRPDDAPELVRAVATCFSECRGRGDGVRRIRHLPPELRARLVDVVSPWLSPLEQRPAGRELVSQPSAIPLGPAVHAAALGFPFGRAPAETFDRLAAWSERFGDGTLRISSLRSILVPNVPNALLASLLVEAAGAGLIVDGRDARSAFAACPGAPACASAATDTQADALRLVAAFGPVLEGMSVHVSGCAKGCARQTPSDLTLVGQGKRYGVIIGGGAGATPIGMFTIEEIEHRLGRMGAPSQLPAGERLRSVFGVEVCA